MRGYNPRQVDEYVARCTSQIRDLEARLAHSLDESEHLRREISVVRQQAIANRPVHEEVSERFNEILRLAEDEAKAQRAKAEKEVTDLRADAQRESDVVRTDAREQAERILTAAQEQAERTISAARSEADSLRNSATADTDRLTAESRQQADAILSDARAKAKRLVDEASARAAAVHDGAERRLSLLSTRHGETVRRLNDILEGVQGLISSESSRMSLEDEVSQSASAAIAALEPVRRTENAGPVALGSAPGDRAPTAQPPAPAAQQPPSSPPPSPSAPTASTASSAAASPSVPSTPLSAPTPAPAPPSAPDFEATVPVHDSTVPLPGSDAQRYRSAPADSESTRPVSGRTIPPSGTTSASVARISYGSHDDTDTGPMPLGTGPLSRPGTNTGPLAPASSGNEPTPAANGSASEDLTSSGLPQRPARASSEPVALNSTITSEPSSGSSGAASGSSEEPKAEGQVVRSTASPAHAQLPTASGRHATSKPTSKPTATATPLPASTSTPAATSLPEPEPETDTSPAPPMPRRLSGHAAASPRNSLPLPSSLPLPGDGPSSLPLPGEGTAEPEAAGTAPPRESQPDSNGHSFPRRTPNPPGFPSDSPSSGYPLPD